MRNMNCMRFTFPADTGILLPGYNVPGVSFIW